MQFKAQYDNKSKSKFISVDVSGSGARSEVRTSEEAILENGILKLILRNTGLDLRDVEIRLINPPEGVSFQKVTKSLWRTNEEIEIQTTIIG